MAAPTRCIELDGCFNVRDIGGYPTADGRVTQWQRVYRAGGPLAPTAADGDALRDLGITTVIDLRTGDETEATSYRSLCEPQALVHLPMTDLLPSEAELEGWASAEYVGSHYVDMLRGATGAIQRALGILADHESYPVLVHCHAGKDRTGVLTAVLLGALGVDDDTIVADYALSAGAMRRMLAYYRESNPDADEWMEKYGSAVMSAEPAAMRRFIDGVRTDYGSLRECATAIAGPEVVDSLRTRLLN